MEKLFGIPINQLMVTLLVIFGLGLALTGFVAIRNRVMFRMAIRNVPRRRAQTTLIVTGLMLATVLFSASFATGDTLTHSIKVQAVQNLGQVDLVVKNTHSKGKTAYFDQVVLSNIEKTLAADAGVEGVAPLIIERAPVVTASGLSEPQAEFLGYDESRMASFDRLVDTHENVLSLTSLAPGQVYLSEALARKLDLKSGDVVQVFLSSQPSSLQVMALFAKGANPAQDLSVAMPLAQLQALTSEAGKINAILISNKGDAIAGAQHTDAVISALKPVLEGSELEAIPLKKDALTQADAVGSTFATIFLVFGQFSVAAGIMLIFLIFVMLAAERKRELGIARAVGTQRGHVMRLFIFEGTLYALIASAIGSIIGVAVGWGMVRILGAALGQMDLPLTYSFNWRSVVIAFTLGMAFTFAVVLISSWRVSRLNVIRAIRDIPEPRRDKRSLKGLILTIMALLGGCLLYFAGIQGAQASVYSLGSSLIIIALPLLARRFGLPDRAAFSAGGLGLLLWWLVPSGWQSIVFPFLPEMKMGLEMFFLSGIMVVLGGVWVVVYNSDLLLEATVRIFGRLRGLPPVLRTAVSYPMQNRFRTGLTLAMFSLVIFTLVVMSFIVSFMGAAYDDSTKLSGGYQIRATTSNANPIPDIHAALLENGSITVNDFAAIGSFSGAGVKVKQAGSTPEPVDFAIQGVDSGYSESTTYKFALMAPGYETARQVWQALQREPNTVVVSSGMVPARSNMSMGGTKPALQLEGFFIEDKTLPETYITAQDSRTGKEVSLRVIGVLENTAFYAQGVIGSQDTLNALIAQPLPPQTYMFRLKNSAETEGAAKALKSRFLQNGMQTQVLDEEIRKSASSSLMINNLLEGFMGLGLVVGIAALGVIAARSVVERRQQIGVMRALGFQKGMVQVSFLLESSFIALLGIAIGVGLAIGMSYNVMSSMSSMMPGIAYRIPWLSLALVVTIAYGASLLTTYLPARQASRVYPAEALRYE